MPAPNLNCFDDRLHGSSGLPSSAIATQAERILASTAFQKSKRLARFLAYAVSNALAGNEDVLKETVLGIEVFDRGPNFDPRLDAIVRIDARRLRTRLLEYYQSDGISDPILIEFERGSYVPRFRRASTIESQPSAPKSAPTGIKALLVLSKLAQARHHLNSLSPEGIVKSAALFERVIADNPQNALAHVGRAVASIATAMFFHESCHVAMPRARASIERALEIDPASAEACAALGTLRALYDFDFAGANESFLMGLRLKPDSIPILQARAAFYLAPRGFLEEAISDLRHAVECEPRSLIYLHSLGWLQYLQRDFHAVVVTMDRILRGNRGLVPALFLRGLAYEHLGKYALALAAFTDESLCRPHPLVPLRGEALRLVRSGNHREATQIARKMEALYAPGFLNAIVVSEVFIALEDHDSAFRWLEASYQDRRHRLVYLKSDPAWDLIRADRRFTELTTKLGLAHNTVHPL